MTEFKELMNEKKPVDRWIISKIFITGMFCGAVLTVLFMWIAST